MLSSKNELDIVRSCPDKKLAELAARRSSAKLKAESDVTTLSEPASNTNLSELAAVGALPVAV